MKFRNAQIRKAREEKNLSIEDLTFELRKQGNKISSRSILLWEKGDRTPNAKNIGYLSQVLNKSPNYFFTTTKER